MGVACLLGGCGSSGQDQVRAKIRQLVSAVSSQNYTMICNDQQASVRAIGLVHTSSGWQVSSLNGPVALQ